MNDETRRIKTAMERAWREGYYAGKRDYAGSITGGVPISTPNPYGQEWYEPTEQE